MTYILEKHFNISDDGKLVPSQYTEAMIRPCKRDYDFILKFNLGQTPKNDVLEYGGQVALFNDKFSNGPKKFNAIEEWLIWLELNKGIRPDFEDWHVIDLYRSYEDYVIKSIDLHTNTVLYDAVDETIKKLISKRS